MEIKTYPQMNETIKDLLRRSEEPMKLYILARIEDLEKQVKDLTPPPNGPLTLEELRGMDRNWIWAERIGEYPWNIKKYVNGYGYVLEKEGYVRVIDAKFLVSDYGKTWLAYRRRPEEGTI